MALGVAQAPSFCRLCNVELRGLETWRAHLKSDWHVYELRLKVAEPGREISPPPSIPAPRTKSPSSRSPRQDPHVSAKQVVESDTEHPSLPDFNPGKCLFCVHESGELPANLTHMATAHGFSVPFQDCLAVDLETVIRYLHFIISSYRECLSCGTQRSTVEGAQQHMVARGHCRFDISPDTEEFYEMPRSETLLDQTQGDSMSIRLASGKLISHRNNADAHEPRAARRPTPNQDLNTEPSHPSTSSNPGVEVAQRQRDAGGEIVRSSEALVAARLSKLTMAGYRAAQKQEQRKRERLEQANNSILFKHFRLDAGDGRFGRKF